MAFLMFHPYRLSPTFEFKQVREKSEDVFLSMTENWGERKDYCWKEENI